MCVFGAKGFCSLKRFGFDKAGNQYHSLKFSVVLIKMYIHKINIAYLRSYLSLRQAILLYEGLNKLYCGKGYFM